MTPKANNPASKIRIRVRRRLLIEKMGGRCAECGSTWHLEFNHIKQRTWIVREVNRRKRIMLYEQDFARGELNLLCRYCNSKPKEKRNAA